MAKDSKQFYIGVVADDRYRELVLAVVPGLEERLNEGVDLRTYPGELEEVSVTLLIGSETEEVTEPWRFENGGRKFVLEVVVQPDPDGISDEEGFMMLAVKSLVSGLSGVKNLPEALVDDIKKGGELFD